MNVIFVGGPDSKRFVNNYIQSLAAHGVNVVRHWPDPSRKTYVPADVQAVIVNGDASSGVQRDHVREMCLRDGVPMIVGNNSVSKTVALMAERGLISVQETLAPKELYQPADEAGSVLSEAEIIVTEKKEEKTMKLEEAKEMLISKHGYLRLRMSLMSDDNKIVTRSLTPVVWGDEFFASKTSLAEKHGVSASNLGTYVNSGNPFKGRVLRMAGPDDVLRAYPSITVTDEREKVSRTIEVEGSRTFMRLDGGRRQRLFYCPDKEIRTRKDAAEYADVSERTLDTRVEGEIDGFREPSVDEIRCQWPAAEIRVMDTAPKKVVKSDDIRLADVINAPPGTNFLALVLNDNAFLIPVSDAARALVPETRLFRDLDAIRQLFPVGLLTVRL